MSFGSLGLHASLLDSLAALGFTEPTPVQRAAIPAALAGGDLLVSSPTGSGCAAPAWSAACPTASNWSN